MSRKREIVLALALSACGFLPARRNNPPADADGIAPYTDQGPIELCQEGSRLVAAGPEISGFCGSGAAPARACSSDEPCASRERCLCGRCVVPFCTETTDCREGQNCVITSNRCGNACALDDDCAAAERCDRGLCAASCRTDRDCQNGESCSSLRGVCVSSACSSAAQCAPDERCDAQRARRDLHEPSVVQRDGLSVLFLEDRDAAVILRAQGSDPWHFEVEPEPILEDARAPAALVVGDTIVLYYAAADRSALLRSEATGDSFSPGEPVLAPEEAWEGSFVDSPSASILADDVFLAYEVAQGIGLAVEHGGTLTRLAGPVVAPADLEDPLLWRELSRVGSPALLADVTALGDPRLRLWVTGHGAEASSTILGTVQEPPPLNDSIGYLESVDRGLHFTPSPFNPTFARVAELGDYKAESEPWVVPGEEYFLYFVGGSVADRTTQGLGLATSP